MTNCLTDVGTVGLGLSPCVVPSAGKPSFELGVCSCSFFFCFVSFRFVSFRFVSFRFVSFRFVSFRFVSSRFVSFRLVSSRLFVLTDLIQ